MVIYTTKGPELRPGYLEQDDSYIKMLSKVGHILCLIFGKNMKKMVVETMIY